MRIQVITKKQAILILILFVLLVSCISAARTNSVLVSNTKRDLPIYCVDKGEEKTASISFDAAWGNEDTQQLIDILASYDVKATFFVVGQWVDKYPESVKALADAGHEIMNHSNTHPHMTKIPKEKMIEELNECSTKIENVTGIRPTLFRPPYGDYNNDVVGAMRECGVHTIQWNIDSLDWRDISPEEITKRVTEKMEPGSIVLFHNAAKNTPAALPKILDKIKADGYKLVPISQLIYTDNYEVDHTGRQKSKLQ